MSAGVQAPAFLANIAGPSGAFLVLDVVVVARARIPVGSIER